MIFEEALDTLFQTDPIDPIQIRKLLEQEQAATAQAFYRGASAKRLIRRRSDAIDQVLQRLWQQSVAPTCSECALVAVGGYGREELHPHSDIDLLILQEESNQAIDQAISHFITLLWDLGLQIGHSVRSIEHCLEESQQDVTVATNLLEARLLSGPHGYFSTLKEALNQDAIWASGPFFVAKRNEQQARLSKYNDTAYNLEPNIKEGPGGLRDIQNILWVTRRHFGSHNLKELIDHHFLTEEEYSDLQAGLERLWEIRFALHLIAGRGEERLLFEHQPALAEHFGHLHSENNHAVESFMYGYFRIIRGLSRLNEMLLQLFEEQLLTPKEQRQPTPLNEHFGTRGGYLTLLQQDALERDPSLALELFSLLQKHPALKGLTAETIRQLRNYRQPIAEHFAQHPPSRQRFLQLFYHGNGLTHTLRRMNRYGLLGAYLPEFEKITGLMQHDLFHAYTVDEHTLFVVRNLRRFTVPDHRQEFPFQSQLIEQLKHPERLYLAGLFHDIAKGRGGNHSQLGVGVVQAFCKRHYMDEKSCSEVCWLVENHLIMSSFAQRRDIDDPDEITRFAAMVGTQPRLEMLYLLTVADIRATNRTLWNHFKDALLHKLYSATHNLLNNPESETDHAAESRLIAEKRLVETGHTLDAIHTLWSTLDEDYFLKHDAQEIEWHTNTILQQPQRPLIDFHQKSHLGGSEILIYTRDQQFLFSIIVHAMEALHLDIQAARINTTDNSYALDIFTVLDQEGKTLRDPEQIKKIGAQLTDEINTPSLIHQPVNFRRTRHQKHFHQRGHVAFRQDSRKQQTVLKIDATDRPGLLSTICQVLMAHNIRIHAAKIATLGERVEDIFWITHQDNRPIQDEALHLSIEEEIQQALDA